MFFQLKKRRKAREFITKLCENSHKVLVIHYACESLSDGNQGYSPRITSIVVRSLRGDFQECFSIHLVAEVQKISREKIEMYYDKLELLMLKDFYAFAKKHSDSYWLNWNMRNVNYGFEAIRHRFKVLGGSDPVEIPYENRVNIPAIISEIYGFEFEPHPKMTNLIKSNFKDFPQGFLTGAQEIVAFKNKEFFKLHTSTIVKTNIFSKVVFKLNVRTLKVSNKDLILRLQILFTHPVFLILAFISSIVTILLAIFQFFN